MTISWMGKSQGSLLTYQASKLCKCIYSCLAFVCYLFGLFLQVHVDYSCSHNTRLCLQRCVKQQLVRHSSYKWAIWAHSIEQVGFIPFKLVSFCSIIFFFWCRKYLYSNHYQLVFKTAISTILLLLLFMFF